MKITNYQIDSLWSALASLGQEKNIPLKISFQFVKVKQAVAPLFEALDEIRQKAAKKHADKEGKFLPNSKELKSYIEELNPILQQSQEVVFPEVDMDAFMELDINISPSHAESLLLLLPDQKKTGKK